MTTELNNIRHANMEECLEMVRQALLQGGTRTPSGFETVSVHATTGLRYAVCLPYTDLSAKGIVYRKSDTTIWHSVYDCTLPFARSLAVLVLREAYSRRNNMNIGANLPQSYVQFMENLAAGYDKTEAANLVGLTRKQISTVTDKLLVLWQARSVSWLIAKYILAQHSTAATTTSTNPYDTSHT